MDLSAFRKEYSDRDLRRGDLHQDPMVQFERWFQQATELGLTEPNAMSLATADATGRPLVRTVLLKACDASGFVFFTNYESRKASHITENSRVSLLFPWITLERQVIVQGRAEKISAEESLRYFSSRPRESQLGAWASRQSEVISSRELLASKLAEIEKKFEDGPIPMPPFWGGYRVMPESIEFWQGGGARLHDRFIYHRSVAGWGIERLSP
jgi:pyridoxamine 5'-phosphate oxidase